MAEKLVDLLVDPDHDGMRLDAFLASSEDTPSRSSCAKLIEAGKASINGTSATSKKEAVALGDRVSLLAPVEDGPVVLRPNFEIPLDIRYEDEYLAVLSKQTGLVCHPSQNHVDDSLANALVARYGADHLGSLQGADRLGLVHRLDMETSGLMLVAFDDATQEQLMDLIRLRTLDRRYVTLVHGYVAPNEGRIESGIARSPRNRLKRSVSDDPFAKQAITTFRTLERFEAGQRDEGYSLLECHLFTGRTHQIRVHMQHIHHSCVGDPMYGTGDLRRNLGLSARQFLHSWRVEFDHPHTAEHMLIEDALPEDLADALRTIADRSMGRTETGEQIIPKLLGE